MIIYIANRNSEVIATASSELPENKTLISDNMTDDLNSGVKTYECTLIATDKLKETAVSGNYLLAGSQLYTIISDDYNNLDQTIDLYCEDAGLDLLNRVCGEVPAETHTLYGWINAQLGATSVSGWTYNYSGVDKNKELKLEYTSTATAMQRVLDIISNYDAEMYFTYAIDGFKWIQRTINFVSKRGNQDKVNALYMDHDVEKIVRKRNVENLATVWRMYGKDKVKLEKLSGYSSAPKSYTKDGHSFTVTGSDVICTDAASKWISKLDTDGYITQRKYSDYESATDCINYALREMVKIVDPEVNYEVTLRDLYDTAQCGDRVNILDARNEILLSARIIVLKRSYVTGKATVTLGEYVALQSSKAELIVDGLSHIYTISITSDNGLVGKDSLSTTLRVSVYLNGSVITSANELPVGHLTWYEDGTAVSSTDPRIDDDGFTFVTGTLMTGHTYKCVLED